MIVISPDDFELFLTGAAAVIVFSWVIARSTGARGLPVVRAAVVVILYVAPLLVAALLFHGEPWFQWFAMFILAVALGRLILYPLLLLAAKAVQSLYASLCRRR